MKEIKNVMVSCSLEEHTKLKMYCALKNITMNKFFVNCINNIDLKTEENNKNDKE